MQSTETEARARARANLAETMLASLLGLVAVNARADERFETAQLLADVQTGQRELRFFVEVTEAGARVRGVLARGDGSDGRMVSDEVIKPGESAAPACVSVSPVDMLGDLVQSLSSSGFASAVPAEARAWFVDAVQAMVRKDQPFELSAGLAGRGRSNLAASLDKTNRDAALMRALEAVAAEGAAVALWERCTRLAPLIKSFARYDWPGAYAAAHAPPTWPAWKVALYDAARAAAGSTARDPKLPSSAQRLHQIAKLNTPFSFSSNGAKVLAQHRKPEAT